MKKIKKLFKNKIFVLILKIIIVGILFGGLFIFTYSQYHTQMNKADKTTTELKQCNKDKKDLNKQIKELQKQLQDKDTEINNLNTQIQEKDNEITNLKN